MKPLLLKQHCVITYRHNLDDNISEDCLVCTGYKIEPVKKR